MDWQSCRALVTGANRGLGQAYVRALLDAGVARVYAAAREPAPADDARVTPVRLDVTRDEQVAAAAAACPDVDLLISNAGTMQVSSMLADGGAAALQRDLDVNLFGTLRVARAFAPVLARNGGGTLVNMLSVTAWFVSPINPTYCVSKAAAAAMTEGLRVELRAAGTHVMGVFAGLIDTDMVRGVDRPKAAPADIAACVLRAIAEREEYVLADSRARELWETMQGAPAVIARATNPAPGTGR